MILLRMATVDDLDALHTLAKEASLGVTNLPKNRELLKKRILLSEQSVAKIVMEPNDEIYLFVLEHDKQVVGTSTLLASSHFNHPSPYYKKGGQLLHLHYDDECPTELCGLYLGEKMRHHHAGRLLSLGRLLFISDHLQRFREKLSADLRGVIFDNGECPFWDEAIAPYCKLSFKEAIDLYIKNPQELYKLLPKGPLPLPHVCCEVHMASIPALKMLEQEGFSLSGEIHPLDGGPRVTAPLKNTRSIQKSGIAKVVDFIDIEEGHSIISTTSGPFIASVGHFEERKGGIALSKKLQKLLGIQTGDFVRTISERP